MAIYTYLAGDWDHDFDAIATLRKWNESDHWSLSFNDVHESRSSRDSSLNCSIKESLRKRLEASEIFILVVGEHTNTVTAGSCSLCNSYNHYSSYCARGRTVDSRSFIKYECEKAAEKRMNIVVLYKAARVERNKCPSALQNIGVHVPMYNKESDGTYSWNYQAVKAALAR